jgi:hypothetical protein
MIIVLCVMAAIPLIFFSDNDLLAKFGLGGKGGDSLQELRAKAPKNITNVKTDKDVTVYKWRDANGVMQFSHAPPPDGGQAEAVNLRSDTNIVKAIKVPEAEEEASRSRPRVMSTGNPYTPGGMKDLVEQTSAMTEKLNQQAAEREKMMQDLFPQR